MKLDAGVMRIKTKDYYVCNDAKEALYQCRYEGLRDRMFLCGKCLMGVKMNFLEVYQCSGMWKSKNR